MNIFQIIASNDIELPRYKEQLIGERMLRYTCSQVTNPRRSQYGANSSQTPENLNSQTTKSTEKSHNKYIIKLKNRYKKAFNVLIGILIYASVCSSLYFLAFQQKSESAELFDTLIWVFFILDFILCFFSETTTKYNRKVKTFKDIIETYTKGWMIFDILSLLPLKYTGNPNAEYLLRLFRVFKADRLFKLFNISEYSNNLSGIFYDESQAKNKLKIQFEIAWTMLENLITMLFITFVLACLWYYYIDLIDRRFNEQANFIENFGLNKSSKPKIFLVIWYFIFSTLATVGYGDYYSTNQYEMMFAVLIVLAGTAWFAYMMGQAVQLLNSFQDLNSTSERKRDTDLWLRSIEQTYGPLPSCLKQKIIIHFTNDRKTDKLGRLSKYSQYEQIELSNITLLDEIPEAAKELVISHLCGDLFKMFPAFFLEFHKAKYEICEYLQPRIYVAGEIILNYDSYVGELLFITSGSYQLGLVVDSVFREIFTLDPPGVVGDYYLFCKKKSLAEYKAKENVKGYAVPAYVIEDLSRKYAMNFKRYCEDLDRFYYELIVRGDKEISKKREETKEVELEGLINEKVLGKRLILNIASCYICRKKQNAQSFEKIYKEIELVETRTKKSSEARKNLIQNLRSLLVKNLLKPIMPVVPP